MCSIDVPLLTVEEDDLSFENSISKPIKEIDFKYTARCVELSFDCGRFGGFTDQNRLVQGRLVRRRRMFVTDKFVTSVYSCQKAYIRDEIIYS